MAIDPALMEILACPCPVHAPVSEEPEAIRCTLCLTTFPVRDGIPVMLLEEATPGPAGIGTPAGG
ncbi:MAG: Trm112 family protein [Actinomycetales bacterium]|nr:Trm112 family protein [Actinomycetales bacterium]